MIIKINNNEYKRNCGVEEKEKKRSKEGKKAWTYEKRRENIKKEKKKYRKKDGVNK